MAAVRWERCRAERGAEVNPGGPTSLELDTGTSRGVRPCIDGIQSRGSWARGVA